MFDDRVSIRVGASVLLIGIIAVAGLLILGGVRIRSGFHVTLLFEHPGTLESGADVQVAGRVIGEVESVRLQPLGSMEPGHPLAKTGGVVLRVRIENRFASRTAINGEMFVNSKGVLGERYLEIGPPANDVAPERPLQEGDVIRGIDPPRLDKVLRQSFENLTNSTKFIDEVAPHAKDLARELGTMMTLLEEIDPGEEAFSKLRANSAAAMANGGLLWLKLSQANIDFDDVEALATKSRQTLARARGQLADIQQLIDHLSLEVDRIRGSLPTDLVSRFEKAAAQAEQSYLKVNIIMAKLEALLALIEQGEGTVGALLNDPEFIDDAKKLGKILKRQPWRIIGRPPPEDLKPD